MKFLTQLTFRSLVGHLTTVVSALGFGLAIAQPSTLEWQAGAGNGGPAGNGPTFSGSVTSKFNTNNPTGNTFIASTPSTLTTTVTLSNQQYSLPAAQSANLRPMAFGSTASVGTLAAPSFVTGAPIYAALNGIGAPNNAMFSSLPTNVGSGIDIAANGALQIYLTTRPLANAGSATNGRYYYGDITFTFSLPLSNPVLHISGLGGQYTFTPAVGAPSTLGFTTELELDTVATPGVNLSKLSGSPNFNVNLNRILNSATNPGASCTAGIGACGSVLVTGTNITSVKMRVYLRGDGGISTWEFAGDGTNPRSLTADAWYFGGVSALPPADMTDTFSGLPGYLRPGGTYSGLTLTCNNAGPFAAYAATCAPTVSSGTISGLSCVAAPPVDVAANGKITCTFNYTAPGAQGGGDTPAASVAFTGQTGATNDVSGGNVGTAGNNQTQVTVPVIDALDDATSKPGGTVGATSDLMANDQGLLGSDFSYLPPTVGQTACANASVSAAGIATYDVPGSGTCTVNYKVCAASPNQAQCDTATLVVSALPADMSAAISGLPAVSAPGSTVNGTITCTASALGIATNATCSAIAKDSTGATVPLTVTGCTPTPPATVAANAQITCSVSYVTPGAAGGSDTVPVSVTVTAATGASNDNNSANNTAPATVTIIDAVDDAAGEPGGTLAATKNLATNDTFPASSVFSSEPLLGGQTACANASISSVGVATYDVPNTGSCVINYKVCASSGSPCDTATLTVSATLSDMRPSFSGLPAVSSPGAVVNGSITCVNVIASGATAISATCDATAVDSLGNPVPVTVSACVAPVPTNVVVGGSVTCSISYVTPGTPGGADTNPVSVSLTGVTNALNDSNPGNNTTPALIAIIDAVDDSAGVPGGTVGATTPLASNDGFPPGSVFTRTGGTCAGATVASATGIATYNVPNSGTCTILYTVCSGAVCDTATLTVVASPSDMTAAVNVPALSAPGATVNGTITCTNSPISGVAANATCSATAQDTTGAPVAVTVTGCVPASPAATLAPSATITCNISYTMPGSAGGVDTLATAVNVTATTSASNDSNPNNNTALGVTTIVDAVDDFPGYPGGTLGATTNLSTNDGVPPGSVFTKTGGTCLNSSVTASGIATYDVPASGGCTITYQVCASSGAPCDNATMTVTATPADMTPTFSNFPTISAPGATVTGKLTCKNVISPTGGGDAVAAACSATAVDSTGANVPVTVSNCIAPPPATVAIGASIVCDVQYTTPGAMSGVDLLPTSVTMTGVTNSTNDNNVGNNTTPKLIPILDALDDAATVLGGTPGAQTNLGLNDSYPSGSVFTVELGTTCGAVSIASSTATYNVPPTGMCVVNYKVCAPSPNQTMCDIATLTVTAIESDVTAAVSVPSQGAPGSTVAGTITCTVASGTANTATCTATAVDSASNPVTVTVGTCTPTAPQAVLNTGATITCPISYVMPGVAGGADTPITSVTVTATAGAINDNNAGNNTAPGVTTMLDALDDTAVQPGGSVGATTDVGVNDTKPTGSTFSSLPSSTCGAVSITGSVVTYDVPVSGSCTVDYKVCAPAPNELQCDTATLIVTGAGADMSAAVNGLPPVSAPGSTVTGSITCTAGGGTAVNATCDATAVDSTGAPVAVTVTNCSVAQPATLALGGTIICDISYVTPGTLGGSDTTPTNVVVTALTTATNDGVGGNNTANGIVPIIDAVNDGVGFPGGTVGATTPLAANDSFPSGSVFTRTGGTCAAASVASATGIATFNVPNSGTCTILYTVCSGAVCDNAVMTVTATPADMTPSFSNLPTMSAPGTTVSGKLTCTNVISGAGSSSATNATCAATATDSSGANVPVTVSNCVAPPPTNVAVGGTIVCDVSYIVPGTAGGSDTVPTSVTMTGITGSANDNNAGNDTTPVTIPIIDAVNDAAGKPGGTTGAQTNVGGNDTTPTGSVFTIVAGGTCSAPSIAGSTITYDVPGSGSCTVNYQVCAPAPNATVCDTATLTVTATQADMSAAVTVPAASAPGATVNGTITCTNTASSATTATAATCTANAADSGGASIPVLVGACTPTAPAANLAIGATITCPISYTMPGTVGGGDTTPTSVTVTATTGASNDTNAGNNTAPGLTTIVDARDDVDSAPGGATGVSSTLTPNDQVPVGSSYTIETGSTCANPSVSSTGIAVYDVPAGGTCTVNYKVCAPSPNATQCDTATLTVTGTGAEVSAAISGLPAVSAPGATVNGSIQCTVASGTATGVTCTATAQDSSGANVPLTIGACTPAVPAVSLASGTVVSCPVSYVTPGTLGGSDTLPNTVTVTAVTSATNDLNGANNMANAIVPIIDAVDDAAGYPGGTLGATTPLSSNDNTPVGAVFTKVGGTCANSTVTGGVATYDVPASGSCTVLYQVCAPIPNATVCDTATMIVTATPSDMKPVFSGLPTMSSPGATVNGTITCTNVITGSPTAPATQATCSASGVDSVGNVVPVTVSGCTPSSPAASLAVGASITCNVSYVVPGAAGGADTAPTSVILTGLTGAINDNNIGNDTTPANIPIIDAVNDAVGQPGGTLGAQADLAPNDQFPAGSVFTLEPGSTCGAVSISGSTAKYDVPNSGSCTVNYKVCAPAPNATICDIATLTVTASPADMVALAQAPSSAAPGSTVNGTITCTNAVSASTTATAATCSATAQDSTGANVPVTVGTCTPASGSTLAIGASIVCSVSYVMPGALGGADTSPTNVTLTGLTGAANDNNLANNTDTVVTAIVDALNDTDVAPGGAVGVTTPLATNDQVPPGSSFTLEPGSTCLNPSVSPTGIALYDVPASGICTVNYKVCAPSPNQLQCDTAMLTVTAGAADVLAAVSVPSAASPGATVVGTITCTNASGTATGATCNATAVDSLSNAVPVTVSGCSPAIPSTLALGVAITCNISYVMPGTAGGGDTAPTTVTVTATANAANDGNPSNNTAPASTAIVDALDDAANATFGTVGTINVLTNDSKGLGVASPANVTVTTVTAATAGSTFDPTTGTFTVPATAAPGVYTVSYQICAAPATVPPACDTATATITVGAPGAPVAVNDSATTPVNTPITVATPVTTNDTGTSVKVRNLTGLGGATCPVPMNRVAGGDQSKAGSSCIVGGAPGITCTVATTHGSVTMCQDGTYTYTPTTGYTGADSFVYQIVDGAGQTANATVNLTVSGTPDVVTAVRLTAAGGSALPGTPVVATVDYGNVSPVTASNVTVTLQLPAGLSGVVPSNGGVYNPATGLVTWPVIPTVAGNTPVAGTFTVNLPMPSSGALDAVSSASVPGGETTVSNNNGNARLNAPEISVPTLSESMMVILMILMLLVAVSSAPRLRRR